ncbi:Hypothetical_protein [Hexamita inflata]|uniref:Hypothetical_protein n=1 Tax=Hexamita inflata TaxID=28002 RepID=A0AA86PRR0_9EUKA|nr:Hypothetical protein HINF_LOCUS29903 [Hexamita inflata]
MCSPSTSEISYLKIIAEYSIIFQQKIKSLKKIENIEDILKQREYNLPAQQEQPKRSQSAKPNTGTGESSSRLVSQAYKYLIIFQLFQVRSGISPIYFLFYKQNYLQCSLQLC